MASFSSMKLSELTFGKLFQVAQKNCTLANYNKWLDQNIANYYKTYVKPGKIDPYFHAMGASALLSFGAMYPYALEEHIEKNPSRYFCGQYGLSMVDYLAAAPENHFTPVLKTTVALTKGH